MDRVMIENWKVIPWTNGFYEVSDLGNVRSVRRTYVRANGRSFTAAGRLVPIKQHGGYHRVRLNVPGFPQNHTVHKLVLETFVKPRPPTFVARHLDGEPTHNALKNLKWGTHTENQADRVIHGTNNAIVASRLMSDEQIVSMRERRLKGDRLKDLSKDFGVTMSYATMICTGKMAVHIGGPILAPMLKSDHRKITEVVAREIVQRRLSGEKIVPLGKEFGVSHSYIKTLVERYSDES